MSNILSNFKENKKALFISVIIIFALLIVIAAIALFIKNNTKKISYTVVEDRLVTAAKKYLQAHPEFLPTISNNTTYINAEDLEKEKLITNIQKMLKDSSCTATVEIIYQTTNNYNFRPNLMCANYQTQEIVDKIIDDNPIIPDGAGLYNLNGDYVFKGENPNNYLFFANHLFRIIKINNNNLYVIAESGKAINNQENQPWDNRYNNESQNTKGINDYNLSRLKENTIALYEQHFKSQEKFLVPFETCIANRSLDEANNTGTVECSIITENMYVGNLALYDYINATTDQTCLSAADKSCQNYNYLKLEKTRWWTATPTNINTYTAYAIRNTGTIESEVTNTKHVIRPTLMIKGDSLFNSGNGSVNDPYTIK